MAQSTPVIDEQTLLPLRIDVRSINLSDDEFYRLCRDNRELRLELTAQGELLIMSLPVPRLAEGTASWGNVLQTGLKPMALESASIRRPDSRYQTERNVRRPHPGFVASAGRL
jgi:hypothetical protein